MIIVFSSVTFSQGEQDSTQINQQSDSLYVMQKSPWGAVLRSAVLPGLGQIYNESYWKVPVIWGTLYYLIDIWISNNNSYDEFKILYDNSLSSSSTGNSLYKRKRDFYRDQRDQFAVYIGLAYFLNLVDAYVDAQLFDFDVTENPFREGYQINMRIKL